MTSQNTPSRTFVRNERFQTKVLEATVDYIRNHSIEDVTVPRIAEAAGVNRTSIYRRWQTQEHLILDAVLHQFAGRDLTPDTGSLLGDLRAHLSAIRDFLARPEGIAVVRAIVAPQNTEALQQAKTTYFDQRVEQFQQILDRAVARGEIAEPPDPRLVLDMLVAPLQMRVLMHEPLDEGLPPRIARMLVDGLGLHPRE